MAGIGLIYAREPTTMRINHWEASNTTGKYAARRMARRGIEAPGGAGTTVGRHGALLGVLRLTLGRLGLLLATLGGYGGHFGLHSTTVGGYGGYFWTPRSGFGQYSGSLCAALGC